MKTTRTMLYLMLAAALLCVVLSSCSTGYYQRNSSKGGTVEYAQTQSFVPPIQFGIQASVFPPGNGRMPMYGNSCQQPRYDNRYQRPVYNNGCQQRSNQRPGIRPPGYYPQRSQSRGGTDIWDRNGPLLPEYPFDEYGNRLYRR